MSAVGEQFDLENYVFVAERVRAFYDQHPAGRIISDRPGIITAGQKAFIEVHVRVYVDADGPPKGEASAWELFPGTTPYKRNAEMMNAETSAIGRALSAAGISAYRDSDDRSTGVVHRGGGGDHRPRPSGTAARG